MREAIVKVHDLKAGILTKIDAQHFRFVYDAGYAGEPVSLTMPIREAAYEFAIFPPFFDGVLPEGGQLEGLLRYGKIDRFDYFSQLLAVGQDLVGAVTVFEK